MLIKENSNLEKDIKDYKDCKPLPKIMKTLEKGMLLCLTTMLGMVCTLIGSAFFELLQYSLPIMLGSSLSIGVILETLIYNINAKIENKKYELAKKNLELLVDLLRSKHNIDVDTKTLLKAQITKSTTKGYLVDKKTIETTTKHYYLLDRKDQIQVLKEVKQIIKENKQTTTYGPNLYLEEEINPEELPVRKKLELK